MEQTRAAPGGHNGQRRWLLPALAMPMAVFLTLPLLALVLRVDPVMFWQNVTNPTVVHAMTLSLTTGTIATGIVVVAGMPLAYLLARRQFRGRVVLDTFVDLPMILPPAVAGVALLLVFGRRGLLGPALEIAGVPIVFTATAVVLAQVFVAAPYFIKSAAAGFAEVEQDLEQAAALDGASGFAVFRRHRGPGVAGAAGRCGDDLGARAGRIRRDDHLRRQLPGSHADDAAGHLPRLRARL